ncbi:MAG: glycerate kinase, partial [Muribaculaceae bacterium]|nr:glycerate kinase [Muribaculaceae bacterium]
ALDAGVSTYLIAGHVADRQSLVDAGFADAVCINPPGLPLAEAMRPEVATANIADTVERVLMHNS